MGRKSNAKKNRHSNLNSVSKKQAELLQLNDKLLKLTVQPEHGNVLKELEAYKSIKELIDQINQLESSREEIKNRDDPELLNTFSTWLKTNGAFFEGISIDKFEDYDLGLRATVDIPEASLIVAVPRQLMLTEENALNSNLSPLLNKDAILKNMPNVVLAMYLLVEKFTQESKWKPYIDVLPKEYSTVLYYNHEELQELIGSPTLKSALNLIKSICRQYSYFYKVVHSCDEQVCQLLREKFTFNEYRWAVSTVMTRQNMILSGDKTKMVSALIPLWDFCNHTNGSVSTQYHPLLDRSECLAVKDFKKGEQVFMFYGVRSNFDFFLHNAFVYEDNEYDCYPLNLGISQSDQLREKRSKLLKTLSITSNFTFFLSIKPQPISGPLLAFLRIFNMNNEQLEHWSESDNRCKDLECLDCALDTSLEKKTWSFLNVRIKLILATYKTTLEEDLKIIKTELNPHTLLAVRMRISEKKILNHILEYVDQYIKQ